ncbi:MAG: hypothetical protein ACXWZF_08455 [Actinomycetota bacterium]
MTDPLATCQYVDVALFMQQMIRERETMERGAPATLAIGDACGRPSIGSVDTDGVRHHFCADHVLEERVLRD